MTEEPAANVGAILRVPIAAVISHRNEHGDACRFLVNQNARSGRRRAGQEPVRSRRLLGKQAEELGGVSRFANGVRAGLAVLEHNDPREIRRAALS